MKDKDPKVILTCLLKAQLAWIDQDLDKLEQTLFENGDVPYCIDCRNSKGEYVPATGDDLRCDECRGEPWDEPEVKHKSASEKPSFPEDNHYIFRFGQYANEKIGDVPRDYLEWLVDQTNIIREYVERAYASGMWK